MKKSKIATSFLAAITAIVPALTTGCSSTHKARSRGDLIEQRQDQEELARDIIQKHLRIVLVRDNYLQTEEQNPMDVATALPLPAKQAIFNEVSQRALGESQGAAMEVSTGKMIKDYSKWSLGNSVAGRVGGSLPLPFGVGSIASGVGQIAMAEKSRKDAINDYNEAVTGQEFLDAAIRRELGFLHARLGLPVQQPQTAPQAVPQQP